MNKLQRKSDIGYMSLLAGMVHQILKMPGVIEIGTHRGYRLLEFGNPISIIETPGVFMQPWAFLEHFGDDTEFEYVTDKYGTQMVTEVNGVTFYATVNSLDVIQDGKLVVA